MSISSGSRLFTLFGFLLVGIFLILGCAPRQARTLPAQPASAEAPAGPHCPDRVERAKTGGFVSGVFGTAVATLIGSPVLGVLYQMSGYAIGFASEGHCAKPEAAVQSAVLTPPKPDVTVEKAVLISQTPPPILSSTKIKEENLSTNGRP